MKSTDNSFHLLFFYLVNVMLNFAKIKLQILALSALISEISGENPKQPCLGFNGYGRYDRSREETADFVMCDFDKYMGIQVNYAFIIIIIESATSL